MRFAAIYRPFRDKRTTWAPQTRRHCPAVPDACNPGRPRVEGVRGSRATPTPSVRSWFSGAYWGTKQVSPRRNPHPFPICPLPKPGGRQRKRFLLGLTLHPGGRSSRAAELGDRSQNPPPNSTQPHPRRGRGRALEPRLLQVYLVSSQPREGPRSSTRLSKDKPSLCPPAGLASSLAGGSEVEAVNRVFLETVGVCKCAPIPSPTPDRFQRNRRECARGKIGSGRGINREGSKAW